MIAGRKGSAKTRVCPIVSGGTSTHVGLGKYESETSLTHKLILTVTAAVLECNNYFHLDNKYDVLTSWAKSK